MNLLFHIPQDELLSTYRKIKALLQGNDAIIFNAMAANNPSFVPPANPQDYNNKHAEIERILNFPDALRGREIALNLMEEVAREVKNQGGVVGLGSQELINSLKFETKKDVVIRLNEEIHWSAQWSVEVNDKFGSENREIVLEIYDKTWGEIVPTYVLQYIHSGILLYKQGMYAVAVALLSIAVEATLKEVLITRGYSFRRGASSVDVYDYTDASVGVNGVDYTVNFINTMPSPPSAFTTSTSPGTTVNIKIKRVINPRDKTVYLKIDAPLWFIDHWSEDTPKQLAQKRVNGLGEAFDIARNREGFLTPIILPTDFDEVITIVRNNLIHLSGSALATPLTALDSSGSFTLSDFLDSPLMVFDLITNVPRFINEQYIALRQANHLII
jgi:hypothetical protein